MRIRLGPGVEFDTIREIVEAGEGAPLPWVRVGPGDDAAVLAGANPVLSTDLSIEGVHFRRDWLTPREVGWRAAMAALSDLAAMGAEPRAVLASVAGTEADASDGTLAAVGRGVGDAAREVGAALVGGDLTRSPGPLLVDVTVVGESADPWLRSGAAPGQELWVTGVLGAAAGAVRGLIRGEAVPEAVRRPMARPRARIAEALRLRQTGKIRAAIDLSDGLAPDAGHLAAASGVRLVLEADAVPVDPALEEWLGVDEAAALALAGGEDYELLLSADPGLDALAADLRAATGCDLRRVGRVVAGEGVVLEGPDGALRPAGAGGFAHFSGGTP